MIYMYNKEEQIKVYVMIGTIIMLLIIFSGITYAFFSASNNKGSTSIISATSGKMTINYADGTSDLLVSKDIQPSNTILVNKTFTLTGTNTTSGLAMPYKVGLKYTSTFSDGQIHYYIKEMNRPASSKVTAEYTGTTNQTVQGNSSYTGYTHGTLKKGNNYAEMVTGIFPINTSNQTITFNLILQFPDTGISQDSEKGKEINGKVVVNYEPPKANTFAKDSWKTIAAVVKDGQLDAYPVGSEKEVEIGGKSYTVRVVNSTTPEDCKRGDFSQTACGFVVEFVDIIEKRQMNSTQTNAGGWLKSEMRTYANITFFNNLPEDLRNVIIDTKVVSGHGYNDKNTKRTDGNWESEDKIYLLSGHEIWDDVAPSTTSLSASDTAYGQTRQLDYYANLGDGVTTNSYSGAIKQYIGSTSGSSSSWWLRAAYSDIDDNFLYVYPSGAWNNRGATDAIGFAPAFRIGF